MRIIIVMRIFVPVIHMGDMFIRIVSHTNCFQVTIRRIGLV
jgi:hypothetical protein